MTPLVAAAALALVAANPTETVRLGTIGTVTAGQQGTGTLLRFSLHRLKPGSTVRAVVNAGTCKRPSASFLGAGSTHATGSGRAAWRTGLHLAWSTVADGSHVVRVIVDGRALGCGAIPGMS